MITEDTMELWIEKNVIPGREMEWKEAQKRYLVDETGQDPTRSKFKAGLYKREWTGRNCVAISSKVYYVEDKRGKRSKLALRSIPKAAALKYDLKTFLKVLSEENSEAVYANCHSFQYWRGDMYYMIINKRAVVPNYSKRKVYGPNFTTETLDITLCIIPDELII